MVICEWDVQVWVDEEVSLDMGVRSYSRETIIYTYDMTRLLLVGVVVLCSIAGSTWYMLTQNTKQESLE